MDYHDRKRREEGRQSRLFDQIRDELTELKEAGKVFQYGSYGWGPWIVLTEIDPALKVQVWKMLEPVPELKYRISYDWEKLTDKDQFSEEKTVNILTNLSFMRSDYLNFPDHLIEKLAEREVRKKFSRYDLKVKVSPNPESH